MKVIWGVMKSVGVGWVEGRAVEPEGSDSPHSLPDCPPLPWHRKLMCELGNVVVNQIYEARVEAMAVKKPGPSCSR